MFLEDWATVGNRSQVLHTSRGLGLEARRPQGQGRGGGRWGAWLWRLRLLADCGSWGRGRGRGIAGFTGPPRGGSEAVGDAIPEVAPLVPGQ